MSDLNHQDLASVQSNLQPAPVTIASTTTVAPTTCLTYISGTAAIATVTPPATGFHILYFWPLAAFTMTTAGNITAALTAAAGEPVVLMYDPALGKYRPSQIPVAA